MPWWIKAFWDWLWYFSRGKIKITVMDLGDTFEASANNGNITVYNCYGSTQEQAIEMAIFRLNKAIEQYNKEKAPLE